MSPAERRTRPTTRADAQVLIARAATLLVAAELLLEDVEDAATQSASAAVSVIAGIAADALCAVSLGERSRGQDHRAAQVLLSQAVGADSGLPSTLAGLLDIKDQAHYGTSFIAHPQALRAFRQAMALTDAAREALRR